MRVIILCCFALLGYIKSYAQIKVNKKVPTVFVDPRGVMRWSDSKAEASFYGVNYTVPFAHAYRALREKGIDHKQAIDRDVYHFARLGYNAYRIHIWDVEISDKNGNLISNEHLDLLDYLFFKLQQKGIRILITGMTNFGNGYPERNENTDAFTYHYDKCQVHANPEAIAAQERYIGQLLRHVNPYTGQSYLEDPYVIGFEINNEPCHTGAVQTTSDYIARMVAAMKKSGNKKPIFYNVSHNMEHVSAYFNADIQGTTYQWYPVGLVAGRQRQGNFLPYIDQYVIPFSNLKGFANKAKAVYEYDPADNLYSYMHPAMSRTFRSAGFQWITQFAYDPMDIAAYNTEYQTHYLNLAYTPAKAISTMIAAEVAYNIPRNQKFAPYPQNTAFGDFLVSYEQDLSLMNAPDKFFYSNDTRVKPVQPEKLQHIAGHGSSPVVNYAGSGAYFLDRLEDGLWRLEVMPDAEKIADPFAKPSLNREVVHILYRPQEIAIRIPDLGERFTVQSLSGQQHEATKAIAVDATTFVAQPGVYLLQRKDLQLHTNWTASSLWKNGRLDDYYAPKTELLKQPILIHQQPEVLEKGRSAKLQFRLVYEQQPDSIVLQTDQVSFWKDNNPYIKLVAKGHDTYEAEIPASWLSGNELKYTATVFVGGKKVTYPDNRVGAPLDWDYSVNRYWTVGLYEQHARIPLFESLDKASSFESFAIPETAHMTSVWQQQDLGQIPVWTYTFQAKDAGAQYFWVKDIKAVAQGRPAGLAAAKQLCLLVKHTGQGAALKAGFVTKNGYTYMKDIRLDSAQTTVRIQLADLQVVPTALLPAPYPVFLERFFKPVVPAEFNSMEIEKLILSGQQMAGLSLSIGAVWLE